MFYRVIDCTHFEHCHWRHWRHWRPQAKVRISGRPQQNTRKLSSSSLSTLTRFLFPATHARQPAYDYVEVVYQPTFCSEPVAPQHLNFVRRLPARTTEPRGRQLTPSLSQRAYYSYPYPLYVCPAVTLTLFSVLSGVYRVARRYLYPQGDGESLISPAAQAIPGTKPELIYVLR